MASASSHLVPQLQLSGAVDQPLGYLDGDVDHVVRRHVGRNALPLPSPDPRVDVALLVAPPLVTPPHRQHGLGELALEYGEGGAMLGGHAPRLDLVSVEVRREIADLVLVDLGRHVTHLRLNGHHHGVLMAAPCLLPLRRLPSRDLRVIQLAPRREVVGHRFAHLALPIAHGHLTQLNGHGGRVGVFAVGLLPPPRLRFFEQLSNLGFGDFHHSTSLLVIDGLGPTVGPRLGLVREV